jgi:alpha-aminoadipic semialdehyde synthase
MRRNLVVGILRETRNRWERRVPLCPRDVQLLIKRGIKVEVESSKIRVFKDQQYKKAGARIVDTFKEAKLILGVKQPEVSNIHKDKIYMVFPHATKGQSENMPLLKQFIQQRVTLIDYEKITDLDGRRLVYFGRFAGICGLIDSLHYLGKKLEYKGIKNPFNAIKPAYQYDSLSQVIKVIRLVNNKIKRQGFDSKISPFIIGVTGHGHVSQGVQEIFQLLDPIEIHPKDMLEFVHHQKYIYNKIYKIVFSREEKLRSKQASGFYFEEYLKYPERFESNMDVYLPHLNMLIHTGYWDSRYPRLVTREMVNELSHKSNFRLEFIADISCDINGSIELTYKTTTQGNPVFTYYPEKEMFFDGYEHDGITILAVDNLPTELPKDSSKDFSSLIRDYVYQIAAHGVKDITNHAAIPREIRQAVITQGGRLTPKFAYLKKYLI